MQNPTKPRQQGQELLIEGQCVLQIFEKKKNQSGKWRVMFKSGIGK